MQEQPATVYCDRCRQLVPLKECVMIERDVAPGLPTDQLGHIHTMKHRRCQRRIYLPGKAPVDRRS